MEAGKGTAGVGLFIGLSGSLLVATLAEMLTYWMLGHAAWTELNPDFHIVGNLVFVVALALFMTRAHSVRLLSIGSILAVWAFLFIVAGLVFLGATMLGRSPVLGSLLMSPVGTIGTYPAGPDAPFDAAITLWAAAALVPIGGGLLLGLAARRIWLA